MYDDLELMRACHFFPTIVSFVCCFHIASIAASWWRIISDLQFLYHQRCWCLHIVKIQCRYFKRKCSKIGSVAGILPRSRWSNLRFSKPPNIPGKGAKPHLQTPPLPAFGAHSSPMLDTDRCGMICTLTFVYCYFDFRWPRGPLQLHGANRSAIDWLNMKRQRILGSSYHQGCRSQSFQVLSSYGLELYSTKY